MKAIKRSYGSAVSADYLHGLSYKWIASWSGTPVAMEANELILNTIRKEYKRRGWSQFRFELVTL